ncbi:unnamed protein product [Brassica rapa subsp. narinosa]
MGIQWRRSSTGANSVLNLMRLRSCLTASCLFLIMRTVTSTRSHLLFPYVAMPLL